MKAISTGAWAAAILALCVPPLERALVSGMGRLMLLQLPLLLALGVLGGLHSRALRGRGNPLGLGGAAFFVGALGFWMIPRSVDAVADSTLAATAMRASILAAGLFLGGSWPVMPFVVRGALCIYSTAMVLMLGIVYSSLRTPLCGSFGLPEQQRVGASLLWGAPLLLLFGLGLCLTSLADLSAGRRSCPDP